MKVVKISIPGEFDDDRTFEAVIYSNGSFKDVKIVLDEDDEEITSFSCNCTHNMIQFSMNKPLVFCKHLKHLEDLIIHLGY